MKHKIHIVCGPTASGKSAKALELAKDLNGVIINCDSMQIFDGLPILTAQPSEDEKQEIPHKLYGTLHPNEPCSAGNWREMVLPIIEETLQNNQTPIVTGGTGLYIKALTDGLSPIPDTPEHIRQKTMETYETLGPEKFHAELRKRDPIMAERFHVNHKARVLRAWEVLEATGKSLAEWQKQPRDGPPDNWEFKIHKVMPDRETLYNRCNTRFDWMIQNGALEEAKGFSSRIDNGEIKQTAALCKALGFPHLHAYIKGEITREDAIEKSKAQTRQYAKRQTTWFKHQI